MESFDKSFVDTNCPNGNNSNDYRRCPRCNRRIPPNCAKFVVSRNWHSPTAVRVVVRRRSSEVGFADAVPPRYNGGLPMPGWRNW